MLVEFTVKNYRSIKDAQTLSLVKSNKNELEDSNSFALNDKNNIELLRSAAIYGPNAAGKTNFIKALMTMRKIVVDPPSLEENLPVTPFIFNENYSNSPSEFEVIFIVDDVRYQYGFAATNSYITEEWLIAFPKGSPQRWFSRVYDIENDSSDYKIGSFLSGRKAIWKDSTRNNALFLTVASQLNSEQLKPIYRWFKSKLKLSNINGWGPGYTASQCSKEGEVKSLVIELLKSADFNIHDVEVEKEPIDPKKFPKDLPLQLREKIINEATENNIYEIKKVNIVHKTSEEKLVGLDLLDESDGTQKMFSLAGPWLDILKNGHILVIDELNDNLHPKLVRYLIDLFHNSETNPKNAQLVFTTHDTTILNQEIFRRDQVWFCERNNDLSTDMYPLTDFSPRKGNRENLAQSYLSGRYGALPFLKDFEINWGD